MGQKYEDTTSGDIYTCTAITPGESGASPHYLWVPGRLGTLAEIRTAYSNTSRRIVGINLLHNAYWAAKECIINQRGQEAYNTNGYCIDRWILWDANTSLEVVDQGLVTHSGGSIRQTPLVQKLEVNCLIPGIYNLSIFATKNVGFPNYFVEGIGDIPGHINADSGLVTFTFEVPDAVKDKTHWVSFEAQDDSLIKAAKLELGPTQTLAHKDAAGNWVLNDRPDPTLELVKCQRYFREFCEYGLCEAKSNSEVEIDIITPLDMRVRPTLIPTYAAAFTPNGWDTTDPQNIQVSGGNDRVTTVLAKGLSGQSKEAFGFGLVKGYWDADL